MHVIHLPTTDFESADYEKIPASSPSPPPRHGHASAVIGDQIYIFGGSSSTSSPPQPLDEDGRVWVFDTVTRSWSFLTPANDTRPTSQVFAAAVGTDMPRPASEDSRENDPNPKFSTAAKDLLPKGDLDPAQNVPEPVSPSTYGTLVLYGGINSQDSKPTNDLWTFDIASRIWSQLPSPPLGSCPPTHPSLALVKNRLYTYAEGQTYYLDLDMRSTAFATPGNIDLGLSPLGPWTSISAPAQGTPSPGHRDGAALIPVTTGQGRNYLVLVGGSDEGDIWAMQIRPDGMTAASFKDAARMAIKKDTKEDAWAEVKYYDADGKMIQEGQAGRGVGGGMGVAISKMGEVDGGAFVTWGGLGGHGLVVSVDI